jgi:hypothetical protein
VGETGIEPVTLPCDASAAPQTPLQHHAPHHIVPAHSYHGSRRRPAAHSIERQLC